MGSKSTNLVKGAKRRSLTRSIRRSAKTNEHRVHVIPTKGKWGIKLEGEERLFSKFQSRATAIRTAETIASSGAGSLLVIHGKDGRIMSARSYAH